MLNKLSRLITLSFLNEDFLAEHYDDIVLPVGSKELLQHHGRFTRSTLESCVEFSESFSLQFFVVHSARHVKILGCLVNCTKHPSILRALQNLPQRIATENASENSSHDPWVIRLRVKTPRGR